MRPLPDGDDGAAMSQSAALGRLSSTGVRESTLRSQANWGVLGYDAALIGHTGGEPGRT
jgi:hypothetical protein